MNLVRAARLCVFLGAFVAPIHPASSESTANHAQSDVILVTIDTLRADHVGCYGDREIRTPALDGLAKDGILFSNAFTPSPITNTSHASIFTGLLPSAHGVTDFGVPIASGAPTLAEVLKEHGYATAAFIGAVILDSTGLAPGFDRGFDHYDNFPANVPKTASRYVRVERRGMDVVQRAENWLLSHRNSRRRFVWMHLYDPHDPYDPPLPYRRIYANRPYDGEIAYADSALGAFISFLKRTDSYNRSLIVVVGDHGEGLGEHGELTHGIFLYDSTTHVPLILKLPNFLEGGRPPKGRALDAQVRTLDIFPTVLDVEGMDFSGHLDGASLRVLWPDLRSSAWDDDEADKASLSSERVVFSETGYPNQFGWAALKSLRAGGEKYIEAPQPEFYNLRVDPREETNLYEPWNENLQRLRAMMAAFQSKSKNLSGGFSQVNSQTLAELRALGYLGGESGSTTVPEPSLLPDPKDKIAVYNLIHTAMVAGEDHAPGEAREALSRALTLDPTSAVALKLLGELELREANYNRASELLGQSRRVRPEDPTIALEEAKARYATGDLTGARDALVLSPGLGLVQYDALFLLGKIYARLKDLNKAEDQLKAAIASNPTNPEAYIELGRVLLAQNNPADALERLEEAARLAPRSPEILRLMSQAYLQEGKKAKSQQAAERARKLTVYELTVPKRETR